jgi:hypothetical protein
MKDANGTPVEGRTRWRRFLILFAPGVAAIATMVFLVANGILAVNFAVNGLPFKLSADKLDGTSFTQIGSLNAVNACDSSLSSSCFANEQFTAATILNNAHIYNLNQTVCAAIPGFTSLTGKYGLITLAAGDNSGVAASNPVASSLIVDATDLTGDASFDQGINIGQDYQIPNTSVHTFSQQAPHVVINGLHQTGTDTQAGSFTLPNLHLTATLVSSCP